MAQGIRMPPIVGAEKNRIEIGFNQSEFFDVVGNAPGCPAIMALVDKMNVGQLLPNHCHVPLGDPVTGFIAVIIQVSDGIANGNPGELLLVGSKGNGNDDQEKEE